jgi:effector-binding domain-containing protein
MLLLRMRHFSVCIILFLMTASAQAYQQAFPRTEPGVIEVKVLPAGRLLEATGTGNYFRQSGSLFQPLFRYISRHDIAMTTPVEAKIDPGVMYFWVSPDQVEKAKSDGSAVRVIDVPERRVAAIGGRGGYSESNFLQARARLLEWVEAEGLTAIGEPFAVYWNGPFTPWLMKTYEVQVLIGSNP